MSVVAEDKHYRFDWLKWLVVLVLIGAGVYGNWYYSAESVLYRALALAVLLIIAILVTAQTEKGAAAIELAMGSRTEWRKVIWPTKQERNQTTLMVVAVILIMAVALWGIDSLLSWLASLIIG